MLDTLLNSIVAVVAGAILFIASPFLTEPVPEEQVGAQLPQVAAVFESSLAAPITSAATSMTLTANSVRGGGTLSGYNCFTIDEGSAQAEFVCGTVSGTSVTSMTRGISPSTGTTTVASLQFAHRRGASVKITDFPVLQIIKAQLSGQDTIENVIRYASTVSTTTITSNSDNLVDVKTLNTVAFSAASVFDATTGVRGVVEFATQAEAGSSTSYGSVGPLALPSSLATTTFNSVTAPFRVPMTDSLGYLDRRFVRKMDTVVVATTTGFGTFSVPAGVNRLCVQVVGGGGGGGGSSDSGTNSAGGGGGAGGYASECIDVTGTSTIGYGIGGGGAGGNNTTGSAGTTTYFSSYLQATGGAGGSKESAGGTGGAGAGGDINITGGDGGGAISGGTCSGIGGASFFGGGGGSFCQNEDGNPGRAFGSGGGGGNSTTNPDTSTGGNGASGAIIITY